MNALKLVLVGLMAAALWAFVPVEANALDGPHAAFNGCKGCHAPHAALSGTLVLWGRAYSTKTTSWSDTAQTSGGTTLPKNLSGWTGTTRNCLACHDGSVALLKPWKVAPTAGNVDMIGSHPVAVPYPYGAKANTYNGITTYGAAPGAAITGFVGAPTVVKLYADGTPAATNRGIECGSCHDPHDQTTFTKYLRDSYANSEICVKCHIK